MIQVKSVPSEQTCFWMTSQSRFLLSVRTGGGWLNLTCVAFPEHACEDFRCDREFCIHTDLVCDEVNHCGDGSDELNSAVCTRKYNPHSVVSWSTYSGLRVSFPLNIVTRLHAGRLDFDSRQGRGFFSSPPCQTISLTFYSVATARLFPGCKAARAWSWPPVSN